MIQAHVSTVTLQKHVTLFIAIETRIHYYHSKTHLYTLTATTRTGRNDVSLYSIVEAASIFHEFRTSYTRSEFCGCPIGFCSCTIK